MAITLHHGDCLDVLKNLPANSVDAIVTDPPYGLSDHDADDVTKCLTAWVNGQEFTLNKGGFMGKTWDSWVPGPEVWREAIRVIKPGGYLLAFAGTRTMDLMSMAIRLGGFELQDRITEHYEEPSGAALLAWVYGSGFPKNMDVSKAIQKAGGSAEDIEKWRGFGTALKPAWEPIIVARKPLSAKMEWNVMLPEWTSYSEIAGTNGPTRDFTAEDLNKEDEPWVSYEGDKDSADALLGLLGLPTTDEIAEIQEASKPKEITIDRPSRFFYCGKAKASDREGSKHPTVKPVALMRYLVRLVTPQGGVVMDPFAGSGTTGAAAVENGVDAILIEREDQYADDIRNRFVLHMKRD